MRIGIPEWQGLVSPVFDVARSLLLVEVEYGREMKREAARLVQSEAFSRAHEISRFGVDTLICGAISAPLEARLRAEGVRVVGFIRGPVEEVLTAFLSDELAGPAFLMPGCRGRRRRMPRSEAVSRGLLGRRSSVPGFDSQPGRGSEEMAGECLCPECGAKGCAHGKGMPRAGLSEP
jgi:predicted Fe-Mo cluster-binding NifX family protein